MYSDLIEKRTRAPARFEADALPAAVDVEPGVIERIVELGPAVQVGDAFRQIARRERGAKRQVARDRLAAPERLRENPPGDGALAVHAVGVERSRVAAVFAEQSELVAEQCRGAGTGRAP